MSKEAACEQHTLQVFLESVPHSLVAHSSIKQDGKKIAVADLQVTDAPFAVSVNFWARPQIWHASIDILWPRREERYMAYIYGCIPESKVVRIGTAKSKLSAIAKNSFFCAHRVQLSITNTPITNSLFVI